MENYVQVIGRIAKIKSEQRNNKDFCYLTVACDNGKDKNGEKREADFITADVWDKQATFISQYLGVGDLVMVKGVLKNDRYEKNGEKTSRQYFLCKSIKILVRKNQESGMIDNVSSCDAIDLSREEIPL